MLTLMVGLPRSGKSTWINEYSGIYEAVISNDWIREEILGNQYSSAANPAIWMITDSCTRLLLSQGFDVILDGINHTRYVRGLFLDIAREYKHQTRIVYMNTPLSYCVQRNEITKKLPTEKITQMHRQMEKPTEDECDILVQPPFENSSAS